METGFHSQLGNYVVHTHPVYINTLCSTDGQTKLKDLIPEAHWIKYATPGEAVTFELKKIIEDKNLSPHKDDLIFLLENHGIIVSSNNHSAVTEVHDEINNRIKKAFSFKKFESFEHFNDLNNLPTLFPDQIVYISIDPKLESIGSRETFAFPKYILNNMKKINLTSKELSTKNSILNLDSEKYRQKIINRELIKHRINSWELVSLDEGLGAEIDVRYHYELILHHDPFGHHKQEFISLDKF